MNWKYLIEGTEFTTNFITDHQALTSLMKKKISSKRLLRWIEDLSMIGIEISHINGEKNNVVDTL